MKAAAAIALLMLVMVGCGGGSDQPETAASTTGSAVATGPGKGAVTAELPPDTVAPPDPAEGAGEGPGAEEASPESEAQGPAASGELPASDRAAVATTVSAYITALNQHNRGRVCSLFAGGCPSVAAPPRGGGPRWRRTSVFEVKAERLGDDRARVTATVTHHFSDRKYVSVEDDVIYLERRDGRWLLAKPSGTFYRAAGYPEPPLRAFSPPPGW
jgi:hypothetical protein